MASAISRPLLRAAGLLLLFTCFAVSGVLEAEDPSVCGRATRVRAECAAFTWEHVREGRVPRVEGAIYSAGAGEPDLPAVVKLVALPLHCRARVVLRAVDSAVTNVSDIAPAYAPSIRYTDEGGAIPELTRSSPGEIYRRDAFWPPEPLEIRYAVQAGQHWARVAFYPLQFNPVRGILRWNKRLEAELVWEDLSPSQ